jgi:hypothetical protein
MPSDEIGGDYSDLAYNRSYCVVREAQEAVKHIPDPRGIRAAFAKFSAHLHKAGVPQVRGKLKEFIRRAVHGSRVLWRRGRYADMTMPNVNSLYPAALCQFRIPTTEPIVWSGQALDAVNYGVYQVNITSFTPSPLYPKLKLGIDHFDRFDLEDMAKHAHIQFDIISGYVWIGATTDAHRTYIEDLYEKKRSAVGDERETLKVRLNSIYGNTIRKKRRQYTLRYEHDGALKVAIAKYRNRLVEYDPAERTIAILTCYDNAASYALVGVAILSLAQRIMN